MPDTKISGLTELTSAPASGDLVPLVDVSDTTMGGTGTNKKMQVSRLVPYTQEVKTLFPDFIMGSNNRNATALTATTTMILGLVHTSAPITVNKITLRSGGVAPGDTVDVGIYNEAGTSLLWSGTTAAISSTYSYYTLSPSSLYLESAHYWVAAVSNSGTTVQIMCYYSSFDDDTYLQSGKPVVQGTLTVTAGTLPSTITPSSITFGTHCTPIIRLDN